MLAGEYADGAGYNFNPTTNLPTGTISIEFNSTTNAYGFVDTDKVSVCVINVDNSNTLRTSVVIEGAEWSEGTISLKVTNLVSLENCSICLVVSKQADGRNYAFNIFE